MPIAHFTEFIGFFPLIKPPFNLLPDISKIPSNALPLPAGMLEAFILPIEGEESDEFTEYIPFGRIAETRDYHAIIYWKAGLMQYEFVLATYTLGGQLLNHAILGCLRFEDSGTLHSVAVVHEDLSITIAEGIAFDKEESDVNQASTYQMSIQPSGQITYGVNDEDKET